MREIELKEKRKLREKHFLQEDGTIVAKVYNEDIHYFKDGKYEEIDNSLVENDECYVNKKNSYNIKFNKKNDNSIIKIEKNNHFLDIKLKNCRRTIMKKINNGNKYCDGVEYINIIKNIDLEYKIISNKLKESIIIKRKENIPDKLEFEIDTDMNLVLNSDKSITVFFNDEFYFKIDAPFMVDANGKENYNIYYDLFQNDNKYILVLNLDHSWLNYNDVSFPVTIDPTITNYNLSNNVYDTYIYPGDTNVDRNSQDVLKVGVERINGSNRINRSLLKFDLPEIGTGSQIINATLNLIGYPSLSNYSYTGLINIHQVTADWNETTANWNTMNNKYNSRVETCFVSIRSYGSIYTSVTPRINIANITSLVKKWYSDTPNYGIMLIKSNENYESDDIPSFFSKNNTVSGDNPKPVLVIRYRNQNGIEKHMNFTSQDYLHGNAYVNNYNGNLVTFFSIGSIIRDGNTVSLGIVYNTNDVVLNNNYGLGKGFKFTLYQLIRKKTIGNTEYLEYLDEDGTLHYFYLSEGVYYDEDGLKITIIKSDNKYTMKDKNNITMIFNIINDVGYLSEIKDEAGNSTLLYYNSNNLLTKVVDQYNEEININYNNNSVTVIFSDQTVNLNYNSGKLIDITRYTGITSFEYNNYDLISKIIDENNIKIGYEYYPVSPYRVKKITEYGTDNSTGRINEFVYGFNSTTIIDSSNKENTIMFDNSGMVTSVTRLNNSDDVKKAYGVRNVFGITGESTNKLLSSGIPIKYVKNYLQNTSFENNNILFTSETGVNLQISSENANSGDSSLKVIANEPNKCLSYNINVEKGNYYTFSCFVKNDNNLRIGLSYMNSNNEEIGVASNIISSTNKFSRYDISLFYPSDAIGNLIIKVYNETTGIAFIDDIQLEEGQVANNYNLIDNSDFSSGLDSWECTVRSLDSLTENYNISDSFSVVSLPNNNNTIKISMSPELVTELSKTIKISGHAGDLYNISFWYKNDSVDVSDDLTFNNVIINFINEVDISQGHCVLPSTPLNTNANKWQYFSYNFVAEYDYTEIKLIMFQQQNANSLYITNISLFKDIREAGYKYDSQGNVTAISKLNKKETNFKYDNNNKLISMSNPVGDKFKFEYDNEFTNRILTGISSLGKSNIFKYNSFGSPHISKLKNEFLYDTVEGLFRIRLKGTEKYLRNSYYNLILGESDLFHDLWNIVKINDDYTINLPVINNCYLTKINGLLKLAKINSNFTLFNLISKDNGSYLIKIKDQDEYLKHENGNLILCNYIENDPNFEFYFETTDANEFLERRVYYSSNGKFLTKVEDEFMNMSYYNYNDETGLIQSEIKANGSMINYYYDEKRRKTRIENGDKLLLFTYNNYGFIDTICYNNENYSFEYDEFLRIKYVNIGNSRLITNVYSNETGKLISSTYGNNCNIYFEYDEFNRLSRLIKQDKIYNYLYDNNDNLVKIISNNDLIKNVYDLDSLLHEYNYNEFTIKYNYDSDCNIISKKYKLDNFSCQVDYNYNADGDITNVNFDGQNVLFDYDKLGRILNQKINNNLIFEYEYLSNGDRTTSIVNKAMIGGSIYKYKYDKCLNIKAIYIDDKLTYQYNYDQYNQLVKSNDYNLNKTFYYNYDLNGNILNIKEYEINTFNLINVNNYKYSNDESWKDKLIKFNNINITYDEIGNPVSIGNANLSWLNGRELHTFIDNNINVEYNYDINGLRVKKTVNNFETYYYLEGNKIVIEKTNNYILHFLYDDEDELVAVKYNDLVYYYVKNIQGDIIELVDSSCNIVAKYTYDSLGNIISIKDVNNVDISNNVTNIGYLNPFRFKGYYFDRETGFYYLNSRYYNPKWGRFINADGIINGNKDVISYNLFVYCGNNFINRFDLNGSFSFSNFVKSIKKVAKKIVVGVSKVVNVIGSTLAGAVFPVSADMFNKSIINSKTKMNKTLSSNLSKKVTKSKWLDKTVKDSISKSNGKWFDASGSGDFAGDLKDLHYSVGKFDYVMCGTKNADNKWYITVTLKDKYDFPENDTSPGITGELNRYGRSLYENGILDEYEWDITFSFVYYEK